MCKSCPDGTLHFFGHALETNYSLNFNLSAVSFSIHPSIFCFLSLTESQCFQPQLWASASTTEVLNLVHSGNAGKEESPAQSNYIESVSLYFPPPNTSTSLELVYDARDRHTEVLAPVTSPKHHLVISKSYVFIYFAGVTVCVCVNVKQSYYCKDTT